jgi:hypothetical protein
MATGPSADDDVARQDLPLPDYDDLPIGSLQHRIRMLGASQLGTLFAYEEAHGHRSPWYGGGFQLRRL